MEDGAIMGDGRIALILDMASIFNLAINGNDVILRRAL